MIPDWLVPWWNWWAAFTCLFNWNAIAAVATAIAAAIALFVSTATRRNQLADERKRASQKLKALFIVSANGYVMVLNGLADDMKKDIALEITADGLLDGVHLEELRKSLSSFSPEIFENIASVDLLMSCRVLVEHTINDLKRMKRGDPKSQDSINSTLEQWDNVLLEIAREIISLAPDKKTHKDPFMEPWLNRL